MRYFKIITGFGADDFIPINETEVVKAMEAQVFGSVFVSRSGEGSISGNMIQRIKPDYNRAMGYHTDYKMNGEDYRSLPKDIQRSHMLYLSFVAENIRRVSKNLPVLKTEKELLLMSESKKLLNNLEGNE